MSDPSPLIRPLTDADADALLALINGAAEAYRGVIPDDCFHDPYMGADELARDIAAGVGFWGAEIDGRLVGAMAIQERGDVTLIRHAYVDPTVQRRGIGSRLLKHLRGLSDKPLLVGTWAAADWAIAFYRRHGFTLLPASEIPAVLRRYWNIPLRQVETSVVLADRPRTSLPVTPA